MKLKSWVSILTCFFVGGCVAPKGGAPPDLPVLQIHTIEQDFAKMTPDMQRSYTKILLSYRDHLDLYLDVVHSHVFNRAYLTTEEWSKLCHPSRYFEKIAIPKKPNLKDDGTQTDSEIIIKLVQRINELVNAMRMHNKDIQTALNRFNETCARNEVLSQ